MADTAAAAPAASNPAEAPKTESPVKSKSNSQAEVADSKPEKANGDAEKSKSDDAGEKKSEFNGKSRDRDGDRRNHHKDRSDRRDRDDRRDRNGRNDRSDRRRDGGRDQRHSKPYNKPNFKRRNNEFENLPESDDPSEIRDQVEFYFSTHNLATDEHLFKELDGPSNRPVSIKHVHSFKRMRRFQPYSAIVAALRESNDLIVVDDGEFSGTGKEAVKRKEPLVIDIKESDDKNPPSTQDLFYAMKNASSNNLECSIYAKDFGDLEQAGQIALEKFFRPFGAVMVRKRRDDKGTWKGSVFVEFDTEDSVKQFLALDPKPKFNDNELTTMSKKEYAEMKCKEKGIKPDWQLTETERREQRQKNRDEEGGGGNRRGGYRGQGHRGGHDRRDNGRDRYNNNRNRSRSPRRRRNSNGSVDDDDWNARRDRYRKGQDDRSSYKKKAPEVEVDAYGVPIVKDTRTEAEIAASSAKKRKADDGDNDRAASPPKKSKIEFKEDE